MIPKNTVLPEQDFVAGEEPTRTFCMNPATGAVRGYVDGLEAMEQAIYKILSTERYRYLIYSWNYGVELSDLFGEPVSYVCPELERRIREALMGDERIEEVTGFQFDTSKRGTVVASFAVKTVFGDMDAEKEVRI